MKPDSQPGDINTLDISTSPASMFNLVDFNPVDSLVITRARLLRHQADTVSEQLSPLPLNNIPAVVDKITLDDSETEDVQPPQLQQEEEGETEARGDRGAQP